MHPSQLHPSTAAILKHFRFEHLPEHLQRISKPFSELAVHLVFELELEGQELTAGLRKLLEAKDCAVRAALESEE